MSNNTVKLRVNLLTKLKKQIQQMLTSQATAAHKIGLTPNKISTIGFMLALASAVSYALTSAQNSWWLLFGGCFSLGVRILRHP